MKALISLTLIVLVFFGIYKAWEAWEEKEAREKVAQVAEVNPNRLQGMDYNLDAAYTEAQLKGAFGLRGFLERYKGTQFLNDPRLAWIELDYALLLTVSDPQEARRVFNRVKVRLNPSSPVYRRMKSLEKSFE